MDLIILSQFDESKHTIDYIAKTYLEKASKIVQYLIPIETPKDGDCLFHSVLSLVHNYEISTVELRGL